MCPLLRITCVLAVCFLALSDAHQDQWKASGKKASRVKENVNEESARGDEDSWWPSAEFAVLQKVYDDCSAHHEITKCLKSKALNALSRAIEQDSIQLADGLVLVKQNDSQVATNTEPRGLGAMTAEERLDAQLKNKFQQLFDTHTLTMDLASEGRGKSSKKVLPYLLMGIITTVSVVGGIALKTLAAIAGKALIASKVALTIAGIIALKKLFSHDGGHGETTFQVHADGHNRRNYYVVRPSKTATADPYRYYDQSMSAAGTV